jgi:hypothetical protein
MHAVAKSDKNAAMLLQRLHGLLFMLIGVVSIADGWRITQQARQGANFDAIGPDRYLMALGALMLAAGAWRLLPRTLLQIEPRPPADGQSAGAFRSLLVTLGLLGAFAFAVPLIGFSAACFLFLAAQLRLLGGWTWWRSVAAAALIALCFHIAFIRFADMPLPKGYFGL